MKYILEYNQHGSNGSMDELKWGDQIKRWLKTSLENKTLKNGYELKSVEVLDPISNEHSTSIGGDSGEGIIELYFKKPNPSELDQLISDLSDVGLSEDKKIEIKYEIQADPHIIDDEYSVLIRITPRPEPNFMGMKFSVFTDIDYDMSFGIGKKVAEEIKKQIL